MAIPSTGTTFKAGGFLDNDNRLVPRGGLVAALVRDYRGEATNISPDVFSPFALDNTIRDDLLAVKKINGQYQANPDANEGWWLIRAMSEDGGPERKPSVDSDDLMILQSNHVFDTDITKETKKISFTPIESTNPLLKRLKNNLPLTDADGNTLVEDLGANDFFLGRPEAAEFVERQLLLIRARAKSGKTIYTVEAYPLVKLTDIGASKMNKKDPDAPELTWTVLPDPFFIDSDGSALIDGEWVGGDGWSDLGGYPILSTSAPVGTAGTTGKASFVFADPTGTGDPWTITAELSTDDGANWTAATLDTPNAVTSTGGSTTVKVKSVTAGSTKFRAKVVGSNGATRYTPKSNAVTVS